MNRKYHDDEVEMERRHIREAEVLIARQEEIVVRLDLLGADELALLARETLVHFHKLQVFARQRLTNMEGTSPDDAPHANGDANGVNDV